MKRRIVADTYKSNTELALKQLYKALHDQFGWFDKEELENTPGRVYRFYEEFAKRGKFEFNVTMFDRGNYDALIHLEDIRFSSLCSHHMMTFSGIAHVAYLPGKDKICGISKLSRVVQMFASRPQTQEKMASEMADFLMEKLGARFVMVIVKAKHRCMSDRGVRQENAVMGTSAVRHDSTLPEANWMSLKQEFLTLLQLRS